MLTPCKALRLDKSYQYLQSWRAVKETCSITLRRDYSGAVQSFHLKTKKSRSKPTSNLITKHLVPHEDQATGSRRCDKCGVKHPRKESPAYNKQYHKCGIYNHFAKLCKGKKVVQVILQTTDTKQTYDTLLIDVLLKQEQIEVKTDECFSILNV